MLCGNGNNSAKGDRLEKLEDMHGSAHKDAYETDQTSHDIQGRNVGYNEATIALDSGQRD